MALPQKKNLLLFIDAVALICFAVYPILYLYNKNLGEVTLVEILFPCIISSSFALLIYAALHTAIRNSTKAFLTTFLTLFLFYSYGPVLCELPRLTFGDIGVAGHRNLLPIYGLFFSLGVTWILFFSKHNKIIKKFLLFFSMTLVIITIFSIVTKSPQWLGTGLSVAPSKPALPPRSANITPPNIYYLMLDGYARHDYLLSGYDYDNSWFLKFLKQEGFFVAQKSRCNYDFTTLSLASTLNMEYLDELKEKQQHLNSPVTLIRMIKFNKVFDYLKSKHYNIIAFGTGLTATDIKNATYYYPTPVFLSEFHNELINLTPIPILFHAGKYQSFFHRKRIKFILNTLPDLPARLRPFFVFSHLVCPHPPFVFGYDGSPVYSQSFSLAKTTETGEEYKKLYRDQTHYLSTLVQSAVEKIRATSPQSVIIVHSDHGPAFSYHAGISKEERMANLIAVYLPSQNYSGFYEEMTLVNLFRLIFNRLFDDNLEPLPDKSYAKQENWFDWIEIPPPDQPLA